MEKHLRVLIWIFYLALGAAALWLAFRFILPWVMPFLLALLTARLIEPPARFLAKKGKLRPAFCAVLCSVLALALMLLLVTLITRQLVHSLGVLAQNLPEMLGQLSQVFHRLESSMYHFVIGTPVETQSMIETASQGIASMLEELPGQISGLLLSFAAGVATAFPRFFLFIVTYAISVIFISLSYHQILDFLKRQIPPHLHKRAEGFLRDLKGTVIKWLKAQLKLISVTFVLLSISFLLLRVSYAVPLAVFIALIDALPVLGTGTVLLPWALLSLLAGNFPLGIGLLLTYAVVSITHSFLEPRLIGRHLGLHPLATLMAMYLGFRLIGVLGMISFPIGLILLKGFHEQGYVKLWR